MASPRPNWGPALQRHRDEAWEVHRTHGTTMGGNQKKTETSGMKYSANEKSGKDNTAYMA